MKKSRSPGDIMLATAFGHRPMLMPRILARHRQERIAEARKRADAYLAEGRDPKIVEANYRLNLRQIESLEQYDDAGGGELLDELMASIQERVAAGEDWNAVWLEYRLRALEWSDR
jgi:hypothetical protein